MRLTLIIISSLSIIYSYGQLSISATGNLSVMTGNTQTVTSQSSSLSGFESLTPDYTLKESYENRGGYEIGIIYTKSIASKVKLSSGILYHSIAYKRNLELVYESDLSEVSPGLSGQLLGSSLGLSGNLPATLAADDMQNKGETRLNYLTIPIFASYNVLKKLSIGIGVKNSFLISSKEVDLRFELGDFGDVSDFDGFGNLGRIVEFDNTSEDSFNSFNAIGSIFISYSITKNISVLTSFDQGLSNLYVEEKRVAGDSKSRIVSLGVNYQF